MAGLRQRRAGDGAAGETEPEEKATIPALEGQVKAFWDFAASPEDFSVSIQPPEIAMPFSSAWMKPASVLPPGWKRC